MPMKMIKQYFSGSSDILSVIGALATGFLAFKVAVGIFRFLNAHFISRAFGLSANLKKAGSWAVITGCTDGIGKAYAEQLASKGLNVVLISRTLSKLNDMAKEVEEKFKVKTLVIAADFTRVDIYDEIKAKLASLDIGVLVNNVGMSSDHPEYFGEINQPEFVQNIIHMNCLAIAKMTETVLPEMTKKGCGYIINIGSKAGSSPTPFLSIYSATKAFVQIFSQCLQHEYSSRGITIQAVTPYFVVSKLSKYRRASLFVPSPTSFVKNALSTVGVQSLTTGYWAHEIQAFFMEFVPIFVTKNILLKTRQRALRKKASTAKSQ